MSRSEAAPEILVDVCICTYRRPSLEITLASLMRQTDMASRFRVIVADNDETPTAQVIVEAAARQGLAVTFVHAPARNISIARNACLDAASAPFMAWIDDDEVADDDWLSNLLSAVGTADAVFGRVVALYPQGAPDWIARADMHSIVPVQTAAGVVTGYTSNAMVRRSSIGTNRFAVELGRSGGEDTDFFARMYAQGCRFGAAPDAIVREPTAPERLSLAWLSRRAFRSGQTHARSYLARKARLEGIVLASLKAAVFTAGSVAFFHDGVRRRRLWVRAALHRGVISRLFGASDLQLY